MPHTRRCECVSLFQQITDKTTVTMFDLQMDNVAMGRGNGLATQVAPFEWMLFSFSKGGHGLTLYNIAFVIN